MQRTWTVLQRAGPDHLGVVFFCSMQATFGFSILDIVRNNPKSLTVYFGGQQGRAIKRNFQRLTCASEADPEKMVPALALVHHLVHIPLCIFLVHIPLCTRNMHPHASLCIIMRLHVHLFLVHPYAPFPYAPPCRLLMHPYAPCPLRRSRSSRRSSLGPSPTPSPTRLGWCTPPSSPSRPSSWSRRPSST